MHTPWAALLLTALLPLQALAQPLGLQECRGLRERRDQLAAEAMQAEIALVLATRRRLCPQQEVLAEQANANPGAAATAAAAGVRNAPTGEASKLQAASRPVPQAPVPQDPVPQDPVPQAATLPGPQAAPLAGTADLDYMAYLQCRRLAEQQLRRSRVILYTNQKGFIFYTVHGARLARDADTWQQRLSASCEAGAGA